MESHRSMIVAFRNYGCLLHCGHRSHDTGTTNDMAYRFSQDLCHERVMVGYAPLKQFTHRSIPARRRQVTIEREPRASSRLPARYAGPCAVQPVSIANQANGPGSHSLYSTWCVTPCSFGGSLAAAPLWRNSGFD